MSVKVLFTKMVEGDHCGYLKVVYDSTLKKVYWSILPIIEYYDDNHNLATAVLKHPIYSDSFNAETMEYACTHMMEIDQRMKINKINSSGKCILRVKDGESPTTKKCWLAAEDCNNCVYVYDSSSDCSAIITITDDTVACISDQHNLTVCDVNISELKDVLL